MPSHPWGVPDLIHAIIDALLGLPPAAVYTVIGILAAVENIFPPVPADTAVAIGAFLSTGGRISARAVFGITWMANALSAIIVYFAGRTIGRQFFRGRLGRRLLNPKWMTRLEHLYRDHGMWGIFASRFLPGVRAVIPVFAGVANLGASRVVLPLLVASGLWYGTLTLLAVFFIKEIDEIANFVRGLNLVGIVLGSVLVVIVLVIWWRRRHGRMGTDGAHGVD
jgi:membrane protein DedA with SNARE-associated domain